MFFSDLTYCFDNLIIDSDGIAKQLHPSSLGKYKKLYPNYGRTVRQTFKHVSNEMYIYYDSNPLFKIDHWIVSAIIQAIIPTIHTFEVQ